VFTPVPLPATLITLLSGLGLLGFCALGGRGGRAVMGPAF